MKKMTRTVVSIVVALALVLSLAACGCGKSFPNTPEGVAEKALSAAVDVDIETFCECIVDGEEQFAEIEEEFGEINNLDDLVDAVVAYALDDSGMSEEDLEEFVSKKTIDSAKKAVKNVIKEGLGMIEFEVVETEEDDEDYAEVTVEISVPDIEAITENAEDILMEVVLDLEFDEIDDPSDVTDKQWSKLITGLEDAFVEELKDCGTIEEEITIPVVKVDDKWLIDVEGM